MALSLIVGYVCVFIRDIDNFITHFMRLWFYSSPVIWASPASAKVQLDCRYQPGDPYLSSYRNIPFYNEAPHLIRLSLITLVSLAIVIFMLYYYSRNEHKIIKVL